ncbi:hypothetical protein Barb4_04605 [Bacteroidales bacterium Barb4]|nr:hypothetical protein Barb4_04605 [Bacteroidales bacterium Barb4]
MTQFRKNYVTFCSKIGLNGGKGAVSNQFLQARAAFF